MSHPSRHRSMALWVALGALLVLAACGSDDSGGDADGSTAGPEGTVGEQQEPDAIDNDPDAVLRQLGFFTPQNMDPIRGAVPCEVPMLQTVYDSLVRIDAEGNLVPGLAASWSSPDELTFEIELQPDVVFQDGSPFDAEAVAAHLERARNDPESTVAGELAAVEEIAVVDDTTVRLHLTEPRAGLLPAILAGRAGMVPSAAAVEAAGEGGYGVDEAVGAGPYQTDDYTPREFLSVRKWDSYWQPDHQLLGGIDFNGNTAEFHIERIRQGEIDQVAMEDANLPEVETAQAEGVVEFTLSPSDQYSHLPIDFTAPPLDDVRVRQALNHAVDRQTLVDVLTSGAGFVAFSPLSSTSWAHDPAVDELYPFDPERARELLAEAGHPDGVTITMVSSDSPSSRRQAEAVQQMVAASGITLEMEYVPGSDINTVLYSQRAFEAGNTGFAGSSDPGITLETRFGVTGTSNISGEAYPGLQELLDRGAATVDQEERAEAYREAERMIMEEALDVPMFHRGGLSVYQPAVRNFVRGYTPCLAGAYVEPPPYIEAEG